MYDKHRQFAGYGVMCSQTNRNPCERLQDCSTGSDRMSHCLVVKTALPWTGRCVGELGVELYRAQERLHLSQVEPKRARRSKVGLFS